MASIKRYEPKEGSTRGPSYKIRVSCGYDSQHKKIVKTITYRPDPSKTEKQQEKEAQRYADDYERKIKDGINLDGKKTSFEQFAADWLARRQSSLRFSTYKGYEIILRTKLIPAFGTMKIANIKVPHIEGFLIPLAEETSQSYVTKCETILNKILKDAARYGMIERNPCENVEAPKATKKKDSLKFFTPDQVQTFLDSLNMELEFVIKGHNRMDDTGKTYSVSDYMERHTMPTQLKVFYHIAVFCGMRRGDG